MKSCVKCILSILLLWERNYELFRIVIEQDMYNCISFSKPTIEGTVCVSVCFIMQPSVSGMEPPFGDAFQNYSFVDQALTSTELLATSSDPDFMYELVSSHLNCSHKDH